MQIFAAGLLISFLGSLPLGTLNVAAMQIGIQENITQALYFSLGSLLVEMFYVRLSLVGIDWVRKQHVLLKWMEWLTFIIIAALAIGSFWAANKNSGDAKNIMLDNQMHRFLLGMMMSAVNPVQIPFWFGWSNVLFSRDILRAESSHYNTYIIGIGLGTLLGNAVFIFGGKWLFGQLSNGQQYLHLAIGSVFAGTAILQLIKIMRNKTAADKLKV
jgi:threonine/homoserine/homoserine lactone efflux protein